MRILIADDSLVVRRRLATLLTQWGHEVVETKDGEETWQRLCGTDVPPIAILDWVMPEPDGVELCKRIRETPVLKKTYVLMLTGMSNPEDIVTGLNAGANDFIVKPFNEPELQARVNVGVRMVELHSWQAEITDDAARLKLSGGSLTIDLGLSASIMQYIENGV